MMNQSDRDLIDQLCTKFGSVMEDVSVIALTTCNLDTDQLRSVPTDLDAEAKQIVKLIAAAQNLAS